GADVYSLEWSPDGETLACVTAQGSFLWRGADGSRTELAPVGHDVIVPGSRLAAWSSDGRWLAVQTHASPATPATLRSGLLILDVETGERREVAYSWVGERTISWSHDASALAVSFAGGYVMRLAAPDFEAPAVGKQLLRVGDDAGIAWSPVAMTLASA